MAAHGTRPADGTGADGGTPPGRHRGLLVDFGGVLTSSVIESFRSFCEAEGLAADAVFELVAADAAARRLVADLECGRIDETAFEPAFAAALGVRPGGLVDRLFAGMLPDAVGELFDGVVISGEVGLRKPDPAIYALGARAIGVEPDACVLVDDLIWNLEPAQALGMATVHHTDPARTIAALEELLGVRLRP